MRKVREYWDSYLEYNPLRTGCKDTEYGAFLAWMIEAAGDMIRELGKEFPDNGYIFEKFKRLKSNAKYNIDWRGALSPVEMEELKQTKLSLSFLPTPNKTSEVIKRLLVAITERRPTDMVEILDELEPLLRNRNA
jgi:hypothetical protein